MATQNGNGTALPHDQAAGAQGSAFGESKGKGKAPMGEDVPHERPLEDDDDDDDDDDEEAEEDAEGAGEEDDDNLDEIDLDNVIGRRTRGRVIDFAKAAEEHPPEDEEDEDEDDDFEAPEDEDKMDED